jgi:hypothetical protein
MDNTDLILYVALFVGCIAASAYMTFGLPDSRIARQYVDEYFILKNQLDDTNNKFGGITEHQYQLATSHNMKTLPDTWPVTLLWRIGDQYKIDLSKYKILKIEIKNPCTDVQTHEGDTL